ncbi:MULTISPECIES: NADH:flavin oxidoreductase/NADH oxidase [unclassified Achromobacter]|uniref:NADH:flavin oxidoreductase/NADH oxidase n=1 Tax=unclassified Achromobacter TaxID=2626865 RepID=UPI000B51BCB6|nr:MULTISPECIES: NADH:flavin oxidoreductase/NADH oxidase [unclassified Achromobacter]OWT80943.1 oxidoreductase [Achromobacter sp. HZ34]OWT81459.1 oxidoreductase [Achromobacter sp. HZ28]
MSNHLFSPVALGKLPLVNRIAIAPMCEYSAEDGNVTDWHMIHLGHLALSGAGLLTIEATAVEPGGRITPADVGLYNDDNEQALARVVQAIRRYAPIKLGLQLAHAGRKASSQAPWQGGQQLPVAEGGWICDAPSAVPHGKDEVPPHALDKAGLQRLRQAFVDAAKRAARLGFDTVQLHSAHGYLLHQFLSPLSNQRTDEYGGSLENRMRFPLEVFDAVRAAFPAEKAVGVRVSASDWVEGGWDIEQTLVFAKALKARGLDYIDVSSGGLSPAQKIPLSPGYQVHFAAEIKRETGLPTMAVGLITEPRHADEIITSGQADVVSLARGILYDPRWPWHAAAELGHHVQAPPQYWRSQPRELKDLFIDASFGGR